MQPINLKIQTDGQYTAEEILVNPLNNSISKQQYSFPKADRFSRSKTEQADYKYYDVPSTKSRIGASFGSSQRNTFKTAKESTSYPKFYLYSAEGQFGYNPEKKRKMVGGIFGVSRKDLKMNNFLNERDDGPGPAKYDGTKEFVMGQTKERFSFPREEKFKSSHKVEMTNLGPGAYEIKWLASYDNRVLSKYIKRAIPKIIEIKTESRKVHEADRSPLYHPRVNAKGEKLEYVDKNRGFSIGKGLRGNLEVASEAPGPGKYKMFSEFLSKGKA